MFCSIKRWVNLREQLCPYFCVSLIELEPLGYFLKSLLYLGLEGVNVVGRVGIIYEYIIYESICICF